MPGAARVLQLPVAAEEDRLEPRDFDRALRRMKDDLELVALKRRLLDPQLGARELLETMGRIEALQRRLAAR